MIKFLELLYIATNKISCIEILSLKISCMTQITRLSLSISGLLNRLQIIKVCILLQELLTSSLQRF